MNWDNLKHSWVIEALELKSGMGIAILAVRRGAVYANRSGIKGMDLDMLYANQQWYTPLDKFRFSILSNQLVKLIQKSATICITQKNGGGLYGC